MERAGASSPPLLLVPRRSMIAPNQISPSAAARRMIAQVVLMVGLAVSWSPAAQSAQADGMFVRLTPDASLPSCPGLSFFKVETPVATYYLEKFGAGLAAMIDRDGHDWIGFRPDRGSRSAGEFRGFPNAVHQQAGNYFHPRNQSTEETLITVEHEDAGRVTLAAVSGNQLWAGRYDLFPTHCTFTMTRMSPEHKYWVLYEGTPGGRYDDDDWWFTSASDQPRPLTTNHEGDIPGPEWIAFGDPRLKRVLFLHHHEDDEHPDRFYQMNREMTVFGFGRMRGEKHLAVVPRSFSIGFLETTDHAEIGRAVLKLATSRHEQETRKP